MNQIDLQIDNEHINELTRVSGAEALMEIIWNCLDADAQEIKINFEKTPANEFIFLIIEDDGHGLKYNDALSFFGKLGGSNKPNQKYSPSGRLYKGKNGLGRFKFFALGDIINLTSFYRKDNQIFSFTITIEKNSINKAFISDEMLVNNFYKTGFIVDIQNIHHKTANQIFSVLNNSYFVSQLANYRMEFPNFNVMVNNINLDFHSLLKRFEVVNLKADNHDFQFQITEWNFKNNKKIFFCDEDNIPIHSEAFNSANSLNISLSLKSKYISNLPNIKQVLALRQDETMNKVFQQIKEVLKNYYNQQSLDRALKEIEYYKEKSIYPYLTNTKLNIIEEIQQIYLNMIIQLLLDYDPSFATLNLLGKKMSLNLLKEYIETKPQEIFSYLKKFSQIPTGKINELLNHLNEIDFSTTLSQYVLINQKLNILDSIEKIVYNYNQPEFLYQRQNLQYFIELHTWIFGEEYNFGIEEPDFAAELNKFLPLYLKRNSLIEKTDFQNQNIIESIPNICFYRQFQKNDGFNETLIVEMKKPEFEFSEENIQLFEKLAETLVSKTKLDKSQNIFKFILICNEQKSSLLNVGKFEFKKFGQYVQTENYEVYILTWQHVIDAVKLRYKPITNHIQLILHQNIAKLRTFRNKLQKKIL